MDQLPMPSDMKPRPQDETPGTIKPPSGTLIVRLFIIPLLIVMVAVGIMFLIGRLAGSTPTYEEALERLRRSGGGRTAEVFVGPGSKQRYMDAKTLVDRMKAPGGMGEAERIRIAGDLVDILENHTRDGEGQVRHFLLLALGRVWQIDPVQERELGPMNSAQAVASRQKTFDALLKFARSKDIEERKAAVLAMGYWAGREEVRRAMPVLIEKVGDGHEDFDVRLASATVLGPLGTPDDTHVIEALRQATLDSDPAHVELVWSSALSLAQLNQPESEDLILRLLDREELSQFQILDRERDPRNPVYRKLNDAEQQRILINTMIGAFKLDVASVQDRLRWIRDNDPSPRVRSAAREILESGSSDPS